jgi:hypothetical protein
MTILQDPNAGNSPTLGKNLWDAIMLNNGYTQDESDRWYTRVTSTHRPTIKRGFPRKTTEWPAVCCQLLSDRPNSRALGGVVAVDRENRTKTIGGLHDGVSAIAIYGKDDDEIDVYHIVLYAMIMRERRWAMDDAGGNLCDGLLYENATDVEPAPDYLPDTIITRSLVYRTTGIRATVESLPPAVTDVYAHLNGVTVDGVTGGVTPVDDEG